MRRWTGQSLVQVKACHLFGTKPLPEPMLVYWQLDYREQISVKFKSEFSHFHSRKFIWKCRLPKWRPFCPRGDGLNALTIQWKGHVYKTRQCNAWDITKPLACEKCTEKIKRHASAYQYSVAIRDIATSNILAMRHMAMGVWGGEWGRGWLLGEGW